MLQWGAAEGGWITWDRRGEGLGVLPAQRALSPPEMAPGLQQRAEGGCLPGPG